MHGRRKGRLTRRERIESVNRAFDHWGAMFGKPEVAAQLKTQLAPARARAAPQGTSDRPLEREVLKQVTRALRSDPRVVRVERNQVGLFQDGNRYIKVGTKGKLDLTVYLCNGRYAEIEVKRPGGKPKPHQAARIAEITAEGGIAGWCWDVPSALAILP